MPVMKTQQSHALIVVRVALQVRCLYSMVGISLAAEER